MNENGKLVVSSLIVGAVWALAVYACGRVEMSLRESQSPLKWDDPDPEPKADTPKDPEPDAA